MEPGDNIFAECKDGSDPYFFSLLLSICLAVCRALFFWLAGCESAHNGYNSNNGNQFFHQLTGFAVELNTKANLKLINNSTKSKFSTNFAAKWLL